MAQSISQRAAQHLQFTHFGCPKDSLAEIAITSIYVLFGDDNWVPEGKKCAIQSFVAQFTP